MGSASYKERTFWITAEEAVRTQSCSHAWVPRSLMRRSRARAWSTPRNASKSRQLSKVDMQDVTRLDPDRRCDIVNCFDVMQLVYDVEYVLADVIARIKEGGHL